MDIAAACVGLEEQCSHFDRCRAFALQIFYQTFDGSACVHYVFHYDDVASVYVFIKSYNLFYNTCRRHSVIAFEAYECNLRINGKPAEKIDSKHRRSVEHTDD